MSPLLVQLLDLVDVPEHVHIVIVAEPMRHQVQFDLLDLRYRLQVVRCLEWRLDLWKNKRSSLELLFLLWLGLVLFDFGEEVTAGLVGCKLRS